MSIEKQNIKNYNLFNGLIGFFSICIALISYTLLQRISIIVVVLTMLAVYFLIGYNKQRMKTHLIAHKRKILEANNLIIDQEPQPHLNSEYLREHLPQPNSLSDNIFRHTAIAHGIHNNQHYNIDYLKYVGYRMSGKTKEKKFDMSGYLITVEFDDYQFCNRPLLYFNRHMDISYFKFAQKHKLVLRSPDPKMKKYASAYTHHRLVAYNGFHDKEMKKVIEVIDFNPNLFKNEFCLATIFDHNKISYLVDDNLLNELAIEYHYTQREIDQLTNNHQQNIKLFIKHIDHLTTLNQGKVRVEEIV